MGIVTRRKDTHSTMLEIVRTVSESVVAIMAVIEFVRKILEHKKSNHPDQG